MKLHIRYFFISLVLIVIAIIAVQMMDFAPSEAIIAQAEATAYIVTFAGIVLIFRWFTQHIVRIEQGQEIPEGNLVSQKKVLLVLLIINGLNAFILLFSQKESVQLMVGISLIVLLISPHIFRTMQEKDTLPSDKSSEIEKEK